MFFFSKFIATVKFLREVTPYFRKASIISEVGWELQRAFLCPLSTTSTIINPNGSSILSTSSKSVSPPSAPKSPPRADTRYIPLQLTHLARNLKYHDPGRIYLNLIKKFYTHCHSIHFHKIELSKKHVNQSNLNY